jgi:hypothetical protein
MNNNERITQGSESQRVMLRAVTASGEKSTQTRQTGGNCDSPNSFSIIFNTSKLSRTELQFFGIEM